MKHSIVLFEDPSWPHFRPLAPSMPMYRLRCGIFSLAERCAVLGGAMHVACRPHLAALEELAPVGEASPVDPCLWLNGRAAPSLRVLSALDEALSGVPEARIYDEDGLLAAVVPAGSQAGFLAGWLAWRDGAVEAWEREPAPGAQVVRGPGHTHLAFPAAVDPTAASAVAARLDAAAAGSRAPWALRRIWDIVPATAAAIADDLAVAVAGGRWSRLPFGLVAADAAPAPWNGTVPPARVETSALAPGAWLQGSELWCGAGVTIAPGCVLDTRRGPVVLDAGVDVGPHTLLEGPLYLGPGCRVKAGARLYGESSFGIGNRLAGEIGESTFGDFSNKQHEGFIGHAVLGSWVNLGAMTTCSDLKNNYGNVRVDLGGGGEDTGQMFVGLLAGDHVKTAIGTLFNTGTCVGFASNIFGGGMPPKLVEPFSWGGGADAPVYGVGQAAATAAVVLARRGCRFTEAHGDLFRHLARHR